MRKKNEKKQFNDSRMNLFSTFRLKRERFEEGFSNNLVSLKEICSLCEYRNALLSSNEGKTVLECEFYWIAGEQTPRAHSFDFIYLRLIFNRVVEASVSPRVNAIELRILLTPRSYAAYTSDCPPMWLWKGVSTCCLVPCISTLSKLKRGSAHRNDERTAIPRNRYGCETTRASLVFSLDMRETTRGICMHSGMHKSAARRI